MRAKMRRKAKVKTPPMERTTVNSSTAPTRAAMARSAQPGRSRPMALVTVSMNVVSGPI
ncbi:MAG: hypothetical protein LC620_01140 [Halobacteriales archaeon]|nr:hypothetical protein [Halobacteriales archaeon]